MRHASPGLMKVSPLWLQLLYMLSTFGRSELKFRVLCSTLQ